MKQVNIHEAKTQLSLLLEEVERDERVIIAPDKAAVRRRRLGLFAGEAKMHDDFDDLPADIAAAFGVE